MTRDERLDREHQRRMLCFWLQDAEEEVARHQQRLVRAREKLEAFDQELPRLGPAHV